MARLTSSQTVISSASPAHRSSSSISNSSFTALNSRRVPLTSSDILELTRALHHSPLSTQTYLLRTLCSLPASLLCGHASLSLAQAALSLSAKHVSLEPYTHRLLCLIASFSDASASILRSSLTLTSPHLQTSRLRALLGLPRPYPANHRGLRILSLDGGGVRALGAIAILRAIERATGSRIADTFDLIGGTSSGGVLALALGAERLSLDDCQSLFRRVARRVFKPARQGRVQAALRAGRALLRRGLYDADALADELRRASQPRALWETAGHGHGMPAVFALSALLRASDELHAMPRPYLHCNYRPSGSGHDGRTPPRYMHGCQHSLVDALRATTAAPLYFRPFVDVSGSVFCDGAVLVNNPAAVAVHEARALWPGHCIEAVVSVGTGRFEGNVLRSGAEAVVKGVEDEEKKVQTSDSVIWRLVRALVSSATDTEAVHHALDDILGPQGCYFRLNPKFEGEEIAIDEGQDDVLDRVESVAKDYVEGNGEGAQVLKRLGKKLKGSREATGASTINALQARL